MLKVTLPSGLETARQYILDVLLGEFLGVPFSTEIQEKSNSVQISADDRVLTITDCFFKQAANAWLQPDSLPKLPLAHWALADDLPTANVVSPSLPVLFGDGYLTSEEKRLNLGLDIFGSAFFMLSRYEEAVISERDSHDRFPATASLAYQADFMHRPIVNEYVEILWTCMKQLWPQLERKPREFRMQLSHDVDIPFQYLFHSPIFLLRYMAADILKRHSPSKAVKTWINWMKVKRFNDMMADPCYTFDAIMDISESHDLRSAFYFITDHSAGSIDGLYTIEHPEIRRLLRHIHARGHEIGLHPSYNTYRDPTQMAKEFEILKHTCESEGIEQSVWGGRQHFLRWETPTTFRNWEAAGLDYDSTLSYADHVGFRCGTCYEYPVYDVVECQQLKLRERPLVAMECSVIDERYMGLGVGKEAFDEFQRLKTTCQQFKGDFTLLWHNYRFVDPTETEFYKTVVGRPR